MSRLPNGRWAERAEGGLFMSWKLLLLPVAALAVLVPISLSGHDRSDFDRRIPVGSGGSLDAAIVLGGGFSFDHGSLEIRSHADDDHVRVLADTSGWGAYAVDIDLTHEAERVRLAGKVDGTLHWLFGGPTVNVTIWVPRDFSVDASIEGGPLLLEDLAGPISANVNESDVTLRRADGTVELISGDGAIEIEDVAGDLEVRNRGGSIRISSVRGALAVNSEQGSVFVESVRGPVTVDSERGKVELERVRGDVEVRTDRGRIELERIEGTVIAKTDRGSIEATEVDGEVQALTNRGSVEVEFDSAPRGAIETDRGSIHVEIPHGAGFDLDARTDRGSIRLGDAEDDRDHGDHEGDDQRGSRDNEVVREINGGGELLRLRTGRGTIHIYD